MVRGQTPTEPDLRHYRWLTPVMVRLVEPIARAVVADEMLATRLAFYMVNFTFSLVAMLAVFQLLRALNFSLAISLLGLCAYASSRVTVLVTGTPLIDAAYFCAIALIVWLTLANRPVALAILMPLLVMTKITILPFLALPLLTGLRRHRAVWGGLATAAVVFIANRELIEAYYLDGADLSETATVMEHVADAGAAVARAFSWSGLHDIQSSFSFLWILGIAGAVLNSRFRDHEIPLWLVATLPIAAVLALLSGNFGRMLFAAFPVIIPLALIPIEQATRIMEAAPARR
jgi:hypothetical protein